MDSESKHNVQLAQEDMRPLDICDALRYLDALKARMQIIKRLDVYSSFLDTMRDFQAQKIDTSGVIERVSALLRGHHDLIQGFTMFLPTGYRINSSGASVAITVTTPEGTSTTQSTVSPHHNASVDSPVFDVTLLTSFAEMTLDGTSSSRDKIAGVQYRHVLQYVNQIRAHFKDEPGTYKKFLDMLQSYRASECRNHNELLCQVQSLFKDAPDLLSEFKKFLPT